MTCPGRTRVTRRIAADPTSTALLIAGPAAVDLWPGVRRVGAAAGLVLVQARRSPGPAIAASVRASPTRRTPTSYVTDFDWECSPSCSTRATLTLAYAPTAYGTQTTFAVLEFDDDAGVGEGSRRSLAAGFLDNLARVAERRSRAA